MLGVTNSLRNAKDGISYFGYAKDFFDIQTCDVSFPYDEDIDEELKGRHFKIEYYLSF